MSQLVSEAIWKWREGSGSTTRRAAQRVHLRRRAAIQFCIMAIVGAVLTFLIGHGTIGMVIWGLALAILLLGLIAPSAYQPVNRFGEWLGRAVGGLLTYLMLVPLYLLVFTPASLYLKLKRRDPLHRRKRDPEHTYWIPRRLASSPNSYQRQFLLEDREAPNLLRPVGTRPESQGAEET